MMDFLNWGGAHPWLFFFVLCAIGSAIRYGAWMVVNVVRQLRA